MIYARGKVSKSETPSRHLQSNHKIMQVGLGKKSDPFLRELKDVYDKENINPNLVKDRVKSHHVKT